MTTMCLVPFGSQGFIVQDRTQTKRLLLRFRDHNHQASPIFTTSRNSNIHPYLSIRNRPRHSRLASSPSASSSFYLTRIVFLRALAFVYFVAFTVALRQNKALIGDTGVTPARFELLEARQRSKDRRKRRAKWIQNLLRDDRKRSTWTNLRLRVQQIPMYQMLREVLWDRTDRTGRPLLSLLWLANGKTDNNYNKLDPWLDRVALCGMVLSALVGVLGAANVPILLTLWICQRSLMDVGGCWYGYGWEQQLAELGFHALFLVPLACLEPIPSMPVPPIVIAAIRWHLFRIMMGAGLIKFRSNDRKWTELTAMDYFYETQPVPSVFTRKMHFMPSTWHQFEVLANHFVEIIAPWLLIVPWLAPWTRRLAGLIQLQFQTILICTGNLSFLNWLTMVPAIFCLDDAFLQGLFSFSHTRVVEASIAAAAFPSTIPRRLLSVAFGVLVAWLSIPVIKNLLSPQQQMNASFDPLRLINSYGAFGVVREQREEWIISSAASVAGEWKEYEFKVKPGPLNRPPQWITPYHYRLDWQLWVAASFRTLDRSPWMYRFLWKLLNRDSQVQKLLAKDPWKDAEVAPEYIRVDSYKYRFHRGKQGPYWDREFLGRVYPPQGVATLASLEEEIKVATPYRPI
jgi:lipase maturation factor 1